MEKAAQAPLEHLYDNYAFCGAWCRRQSTTIEQKAKENSTIAPRRIMLNEGLNTAVAMVGQKSIWCGKKQQFGMLFLKY
eukprot:12495435-Ditylum_brightwellii.AAC.1